MLIKVCGMREPDNIHAVEQLGIDLMGFIFYSKSPRYVAMQRSLAGILPDCAEEALQDRDHNMARVGVFVDDMPQNIVTRVVNFGLDYVQLHGNESTVMIDNLRATLDPDIHKGVKIIKAISVASADDLLKADVYQGHVDLLLFDTKCPTKGGSGEQFDWTVLDHYAGKIPFPLSGGIGPEDAARVKMFKHPQCAGIDLNSRFESSPGVKDVKLLKRFIDEVRK